MAIKNIGLHNQMIVIPVHLQAAITATDVVSTFEMPCSAYFLGASMAAGVVDAGNADETYVMTLAEGATTICTLTFPRATAADTPVIGDPTTGENAVADGATMKVTLTLGGTSPSLTMTTIMLYFAR